MIGASMSKSKCYLWNEGSKVIFLARGKQSAPLARANEVLLLALGILDCIRSNHLF